MNKYQVLKAYNDDSGHCANIDAIYRKTKWCINQSSNLIALPMKHFYVTYSKHPTCLVMDLPCHDWDHNVTGGYADEVTMKIHTEIWQNIKEVNDKEEQCVEAEAVAVQLEDLSKFFKDELVKRGKRPGGQGKANGTQAAWDECHNAETAADEWWFPFSMAKDDIARSRRAKAFGKPKWSSAADRLAQRVSAIRD